LSAFVPIIQSGICSQPSRFEFLKKFRRFNERIGTHRPTDDHISDEGASIETPKPNREYKHQRT
jgi:hypothetical protein